MWLLPLIKMIIFWIYSVMQYIIKVNLPVSSSFFDVASRKFEMTGDTLGISVGQLCGASFSHNALLLSCVCLRRAKVTS